MSTTSEQRYVDLKKLCERIDPELFDPLSWILLLNLDLVPQEDIEVNPNLKFSSELMNGKFDGALEIAKIFAESDKPIASHYKDLFKIDPNLTKTFEVAETFFSLAKRRAELIEKSGFKQY
ncbi:MAG: hypothetical protein KAS47_09490 [Candidatus Heimdallarchaeota archaeon]|nr:hypothetical protein [Candidatus Heimdallarchaeota archaeon]